MLFVGEGDFTFTFAFAALRATHNYAMVHNSSAAMASFSGVSLLLEYYNYCKSSIIESMVVACIILVCVALVLSVHL